MQASVRKYKQFMQAIAPSGNLFLVLALQELRRQGLTFIAFYALQRTIEESELSESSLRQETGLPDYEVSRACRFLARSELVDINRSEVDARVRLLKPTSRGKRIHDQVLSVAAERLQEGLTSPGDERRLSEATESFRKGNQTLLGHFNCRSLTLKSSGSPAPASPEESVLAQRARQSFGGIRTPKKPFETPSDTHLLLLRAATQPWLSGEVPRKSIGHGPDGSGLGREECLRGCRSQFAVPSAQRGESARIACLLGHGHRPRFLIC
jgi:DNA-binding MarR family transcriptional regulator